MLVSTRVVVQYSWRRVVERDWRIVAVPQEDVAMGNSRIFSRGFPGCFVVHGALVRRKFFIITTPTHEF